MLILLLKETINFRIYVIFFLFKIILLNNEDDDDDEMNLIFEMFSFIK
jgi:hypothetical protein